MKRALLYILALISILGLGFTGIVHAAAPYEVDDDPCSITEQSDHPLCAYKGRNNEKELFNVVKSVLETVYFWIGILAVIFIIVSGVRYATSAGDPGKVQLAKSSITYAIVGLVVSLSAFAITEFTLSALNGTAGNDTVASTPADPADPASGVDPVDETPLVASLHVVSKTTILENEELQLKVEIFPDYAENRVLEFFSSDKSVATVSEIGRVTGIKPGQTNITVKADNGVTTTAVITVKEVVKVQSIELESDSITVVKGRMVSIKATPLPKNAVDKTLHFDSANPDIATVNNLGAVRGKMAGTTEVTITSNNGITTKVKVTVKEPDTAEIGENGAFKITDALIQHLDSHYNQSGNWYSGNKPSCTDGQTVAGTACGQSSYMAVHYVLTSKDLDYMDTLEYSCGTGAYSGDGTWWDRMTRSDYIQKYGITGKYIGYSFDAHVAELKQGHPVVELVCGRGGFRATTHDGCHFFVALSYREDNGGEIYVWNPTNINQGWTSRANFTEWVTNRNAGVSYAMWKN